MLPDKKFGDKARFTERQPVWSAARFGQSLTVLPDGRIIQIGGEHEDGYDPDFCIYNDVFVHSPDGEIRIFTYPREQFPPTDFHTATLIGNQIYVIGRLGYEQDLRPGFTPVYRLDTETFRIERVETTGESPGYVCRHQAKMVGSGLIEVSGGEVGSLVEGRMSLLENKCLNVLDVNTGIWKLITPNSLQKL
jgi:hypothetical protein